MTAGIVGLGLIGGSLAKAYHEAGEAVLAFDTDRSILDFAMMSGAVDGVLDEESIKRCDIVLIAVYPAACIEYFTRMAVRTPLCWTAAALSAPCAKGASPWQRRTA